MVAVRPHCVSLAAAFLACLTALVLTPPSALGDQTTVYDETGLLSSAAIAQIEGRNQALYGATGQVVVVAVVRTDNGAGALADATAIAERLAKDRYGAVVFLATGQAVARISFAGRALKWVPYDEQVSLQRDLGDTIRYCCPSDTLPGIVDQVASAMETGSKIAPNPSNYVRDRLGELNGQQTATIVARDERLEAATGKGIAVVLFPEEPGTPSDILAATMAQSLDVSGRVAAVVWVGRGQTASHFAMTQTPGFDTIPEAVVDSISRSFQADMQTGNFGDAIVAAVDRSAAAIEGTSTPMPTLPPEPQEIETPQIPGGANSPVSGIVGSLSSKGASGTGTVIAIFVVFLIVAIFVTMALRREREG